MCLTRLGMSEVYTLKSMGERTPHCGTPALNRRCVDVSTSCISFTSLDLMYGNLSKALLMSSITVILHAIISFG